ncbi:MAG: hypothetical protein AAF488_04050, partial [Planctomycetota bacterium]
CDIEGEWTEGSRLKFTFLNGEGSGLTEEELSGEVLRATPPQLLEFTWGVYSYLCEISPQESGCTLRFTETLPKPSYGARDAAGWEMCFENFERIVEGVETALFAWNLWKEKFDRYAAKFEPEMGPQAGPPEGFSPPKDAG